MALCNQRASDSPELSWGDLEIGLGDISPYMEIGWEQRDTLESPSTSRRGPVCIGWDFRKYSAYIESAQYLVDIGSKLSAHLQTILDRDRLMHPVANIQPSSSSIGPGQYSSNILNISRNQNHCKVPSNKISLKSYNPPIFVLVLHKTPSALTCLL